mgnify:CR=1 FL=1
MSEKFHFYSIIPELASYLVESKGCAFNRLHSALFMGTVVYGPLQAHVYRQDESKGVMENPLYAPKICLHYGIVQFENSTHSSVDP